ncbi:MAG: M48 family metalloprotease [Sphingomonas sp.]
MFRLDRANVQLCEKRSPLTGLIIQSAADYDEGIRPAATAYFGFETNIGVEGVVPGSPAAAAGVHQDDSLATVNGAPVPAEQDARKQTLAMIDRAGAEGAVTLGILRAGRRLDVTIHPVAGCLAHGEVNISDDLNAATDGHTIEVNSALMNLVSDPDEFASIVAHELGHIVLDHPDRLTAAHVDRGLLAGFGRNGRLIKRTENEADRLSVTLMANAGYDPMAAARYWQTYGPQLHNEGGFGSTHLSWRKRATLIAEAAGKVEQEHQRPIIPAWIASRNQPLD